MKKHGFTLIELLVVIAIIAILAAILFPVFARARAKAIQSSCLSNIKQITLAEKMYASDYGDRFMNNNWDWYNMAPWTYTGQLNPYINSSEVCFCPGLPPTDRTGGGCGYTWNCWVTGVGYGWYGCRESSIPDPSNLIMLGDGNGRQKATGGGPFHADWVDPVGTPSGLWWSPWPDAGRESGLTADPPIWPNTTNPGWGCFKAYHNGFANFGFVDGHAKAMKLDIIPTTLVTRPLYMGSAVQAPLYLVAYRQ